MLNTNISSFRMDSSRMVDLHSSVARLEEGTLLQLVIENGREVALPTTGANTEVLGGFALGSANTPTKAPRYEDLVVPANTPYTVQLANAPLGSSLRLRLENGTEVTSSGSGPAAGAYTISGRTVTFNSAQAGAKVRAVYEYSPTLMEVQMLYGQSITEDAQGLLGRVGMIFMADMLFLSNFDPASDWWATTPGPIYSAADGKISKTNTGVLLRGTHVIAAPNATSPLLGIRCDL